ncbi:uncharacterized protein [Arachis hypogaea]|uniref:uncharacterized protein n=1 Tax=Arachis hypogaea TaxID=3818 RepID=UPI003B21CFDA
MHQSDQNKIAFITEYGNYYYKVMPFGLKNADATYQCLMNKVFAKQIGRNIEVYVEDMVAKTKIGNNHLDDLAEIFEREKQQFPIYFTSKTLQNVELRYPSIKKLALALVFSARRLRPYFQSHIIHVRTDHPLRQVLQKPELAGRLVKWSVELSEFDIKYEGRTSIKSQFLADFIAEFSVPDTTEDYIEWSLYVDGSFNPQGWMWSRRGFSRPLLKCLCRAEAELALAEEHERICGTHLGARSLSSKTLRAGLYWPTLRQDLRQNSEVVTTGKNTVQSHISWPNSYIVSRGTAPSQDYIATNAFFCIETYYLSIRHPLDLKIKQYFSSVEYPQTNGLTKAANKVILHALRKKLDDAKGLWAELIPEIIWGYSTTVHSTTKETPFRLVYSADAMIPVEISQASLQTQLADHTTSLTSRETDLELIEEIRYLATITHRAMQQHIARRYN